MEIVIEKEGRLAKQCIESVRVKRAKRQDRKKLLKKKNLHESEKVGFKL